MMTKQCAAQPGRPQRNSIKARRKEKQFSCTVAVGASLSSSEVLTQIAMAALLQPMQLLKVRADTVCHGTRDEIMCHDMTPATCLELRGPLAAGLALIRGLQVAQYLLHCR